MAKHEKLIEILKEVNCGLCPATCEYMASMKYLNDIVYKIVAIMNPEPIRLTQEMIDRLPRRTLEERMQIELKFNEGKNEFYPYLEQVDCENGEHVDNTVYLPYINYVHELQQLYYLVYKKELDLDKLLENENER